MKTPEGAGGTPGGFLEFFVGLAMAAAGFYLLTNRIWVHNGFARYLTEGRGGLVLLAVLVGFGFIFFSGKSIIGWLLVAGGIGLTLVEVISSLNVSIQPMPLWEILVIFLLFGGGLGLVVRAIRPRK